MRQLNNVYTTSSQSYISVSIIYYPNGRPASIVTPIFVLTQTDLKSLIAYSRIVHMSAVVGLLLISSSMGSSGSILIRVRHGLARSRYYSI